MRREALDHHSGERCGRAWATRLSLLALRPVVEDCPPGQTKVVRGWLSFYEGTDIEAELARLKRGYSSDAALAYRLLDNASLFDSGQSLIQAIVEVRQPAMVESHQWQNRRMQVGDV